MMKRLLAAAAACALLSGDALALSNLPTYPVTPNRGVVQFLQGTDAAGTYKTLYTASASGSKCYGAFATSNDGSAAHDVTVQVVSSGVKYGGATVNVSTGQPGFVSGVPPVPVMTTAAWPGLAVDSDGNSYLMLASGDTLQATFATALTSGKLINIIVTCADFQ